MNNDRESPPLDPTAREVFENLCAAGTKSFDDLASVPSEQVSAIFGALEMHRPPIPLRDKQARIHQAILDFRTIVSWIDAKVFDAEACRALCFAAIESLDGKTEGK